MAGLLIVVLLSTTACRPKEDDGKKEPGKKAAVNKNDASNEGGAAKPKEPPPKPTMPKVELTQTLEATCLVKVGDAMPEGNLAQPDGRVVESKSLLGPKLTVICFWGSGSMSSLQELDELQKYVAAPYADKGVRVIGVNEKDAPDGVAKSLEMAGAKFPNYLDPSGVFFKEFATEGLPRTYLIDASGKILWFDTEYSQSTKRDLLQAIDFLLGP
jgi:peroxiredoxin